jgi:hypothetical protein
VSSFGTIAIAPFSSVPLNVRTAQRQPCNPSLRRMLRGRRVIVPGAAREDHWRTLLANDHRINRTPIHALGRSPLENIACLSLCSAATQRRTRPGAAWRQPSRQPSQGNLTRECRSSGFAGKPERPSFSRPAVITKAPKYCHRPSDDLDDKRWLPGKGAATTAMRESIGKLSCLLSAATSPLPVARERWWRMFCRGCPPRVCRDQRGFLALF